MGMYVPKFPQKPVCRRRPFGPILKSDQSGRILMLSRRGGRPFGVRRVSVLSELAVGENGVLVALDLPESVQNHLMHMGFVPDAHVTALRRAPTGDPTVYGIDGMEIALRRETAAAIRVRPVDAPSQPQHATESDAQSGADPASSESPQLAEAAR